MTQHLRSRLRAVVATAICALVAAPALVTGTATPAAAVTPGVATGVLMVGGESNALGNSNPWRFGDATAAYAGLRGDLVNPQLFSPTGTVKKGSFQVAPGIDEITPATLANLDVFVGGIQRGGDGDGTYTATEIAALQAFNANGGALVLMNNSFGFGNLSDWLGFGLRPQRAFYGTSADCATTAAGEQAPVPSSQTGGAHPVTTTGPFGNSSGLSMFHTATVMTIPGTAQARYSINVTNQTPTLAITDPIGRQSADGINFTRVNAPITGSFTIQTAATTSSGITSVSFYDGAALPGNLLFTDATFPYEAPNVNSLAVADGTRTLRAVATLTAGGTIEDTIDIDVDVAPFNPAPTPPAVLEIDPDGIDCPGANGEGVDNNLTGTTVATIDPGALVAGSGPIIVTTDLDFFSNFFTGATIGQNRTFALNAFAWIMDEMVPDVPDDTYFPLTNPVRVYDSRQTTPLTHLESRAIQISGVGAVPADAKTVIANVTVVDPDSAGYFTVYPTDATRPDTSTHNFRAGENFANMITMRLSPAGQISVFDYLDTGGNVDVLVDIVGVTRRDNAGTRLHTMAPSRVLDTRNGIGLPKAPFGAGQTQNLTVRGGATGVPVDAESVVLNMTVTGATDNASFVTVWPAGLAQPGVSNLNNVVGVARPNLVVARVNGSGQISIANAFGSADIIADVVGYFSQGVYQSGGVITGLNPARILDTRPNNAFGPGQVRSLVVLGAGGIPGTAKTAILKVTAVDPDAAGGFLTVWPAGTANPPTVSNLNFGPGMTIPNLVVTQIGTAGQINIYNALGSTHVLVDVLGYAD